MRRVGWVVDCQRDFMEPSGRLYVKDLSSDTDAGAASIEAALVTAVDWMREYCEIVVFTGDWHGYDDAEIDLHEPDPAQGTYPPHCMGRSGSSAERAGAEIIPAIAPHGPVVVPVGAQPGDAEDLVQEALERRRDLFIQKNRFDVFVGNAATGAVVEALEAALGGPLEFVVVGVARDVCVTQAVDGMQARGYATRAVSDATWGLGLEAEAETLERWRRGGRVGTLSGLLEESPPESPPTSTKSGASSA
jgi:nicotinamidase-related amidase